MLQTVPFEVIRTAKLIPLFLHCTEDICMRKQKDSVEKPTVASGRIRAQLQSCVPRVNSYFCCLRHGLGVNFCLACQC